MVALNFNAAEHKPQYGAGDPGFPDGRHPVVIVASDRVPVEKMGTVVGHYLALKLAAIDGPAKGLTMTDRLNLDNQNPDTVRIANQQLSAYCHVTGVFKADLSEQLHNIPFVVEVGRQIDKTTKQTSAYGEIKKLYDMNGREPGQTGQGPMTGGAGTQPQPTAPPPAGVTADGGGWNGGANAQPAADPSQGGGGNWGGPATQPAATGFGGGGGPNADQGGGGAWQPQGGGQGGGAAAPAWGQR